jgi:hypothetical protein
MRSFVAFLLLCCCISSAFVPVLGRSVTWLQNGGGNLQSPENWDSAAVPGPDDDVVIRLRDAPGWSTMEERTNAPAATTTTRSARRHPWESSAASDFGSSSSFSGNMLTLMESWTVRSLTLSGGGASLVVDAPVHLSGSLSVSRGAGVLVKGGTLTAARIDVGDMGTLSVDLGTIGSEGSGEPTTALRVASGGTLLLSSGEGSSHFSRVTLTLASGATALWDAGPLILDSSTLSLDSGATFLARAEILTSGEAHSSSAIKNAGKIVFESLNGGAQMCGIPLTNTNMGTLVVTGPVGIPSDLRMLNLLTQEGSLQVSGSRTLALWFEKAVFAPSSRTSIEGSRAALMVSSGEVTFGGRLTSFAAAENGGGEGGGEVILSSAAVQAGQMDVARLSLRAGGSLSTAAGKTSTIRQLDWNAGTLTGEGTVNVGTSEQMDGVMLLQDPSGSKILAAQQLNVHGVARVGAGSTLLLQDSTSLHVAAGSTLVHESQSSVISGDDSPISLRLDAGSNWRFETGGGGEAEEFTTSGSDNATESSSSSRSGSNTRLQTIVSVPVSCAGGLVLTGGGEAVFRRDGRFKALECQQQAGLRLQGQSNDTSFVFTDPLSCASDENQFVLVQSARAELQSSSPSVFASLALLDGQVRFMRAGADVERLTLGSAAASSLIEGPAHITAREVYLKASTVKVEEITSVPLAFCDV